jgi:hypothetical protein
MGGKKQHGLNSCLIDLTTSQGPIQIFCARKHRQMQSIYNGAVAPQVPTLINMA